MFLDMASWKAALLLAMRLSYIPIGSASPLTPQDQSIKAVISGRSATSNLDILTPNENGELIRSSTSLRERQQPGDVTYIGDGKCASSTFSATSFSCGLFCTTQTIVAKGAAQKASADINCQTTGCSAAVTQTTTISNSFTINGNIGGNAGPAWIKAQAQLGASYTWQTSAATANSYSFTPTKGDIGHIVFVSYVLEACGTFTEFKWDAFCMDWSYSYDVFNQPLNFDPMSCGQTPVTLASGAADGVYSFCNTTSGVGCG